MTSTETTPEYRYIRVKKIHLFFWASFLSLLASTLNLDAQDTEANHYTHNGVFTASPRTTFEFNQVKPTWLWEDAKGDATIQALLHQAPKWERNTDWEPTGDKVYWLKTKLIGNTDFHGEQAFYVTHDLTKGINTFDYLDVWLVDSNGNLSHQKTGNKVPRRERPYNSGTRLIKVEIASTDTLDVYIRMMGINPFYPIYDIRLWHVDTAIFQVQTYEGFKAGLFLGILGIQSFFFLLLFFIERDKIHLYFSLLIFGLFLNRSFYYPAKLNFDVFPYVYYYHDFLCYLGLVLALSAGLLFARTYLNYPDDGFISKKILRIYLFIMAFFYGLFLFPLFGVGYHLLKYYTLVVDISTIATPVLGLIMIVTANTIRKKSKRFLLIAFLPLILATMINAIAGLDMAWGSTGNSTSNDVLNIAIILMLLNLAAIIGYRTNLLKAEKEEAIKQHVKDEQLIFEQQLQAKQVENINRLKTRLYTNITHEFRTPLTVIMGINDQFRQYLKGNISTVEKTNMQQGAGLIRRNSENLLQLINQLLDLSKADSGEMTLKEIQADIIPYLNYLTESFYSKAKEKNIRLVFYPETDSLLMDFDEIKIQQIVYNLLSNALKFTDKGGKIVFHSQKITIDNETALQLKISDNGRGIPAEKLPYIFDRFYQADNSSTRKSEGTGIGLALVKELVDLMEGSIEAESEPNKGTVFTILLPIRNEAKIITQNTPEDSLQTDLIEEENDVVINHDVSEQNGELPLLLIVEDNQDVTIYIRRILENHYRIETTKNGALGIEKAFESIPDLIISDVMMPEKDGFELTEIIKNDTRTSHIPIILLTAKATEQYKLEGLKMGADAYLTKPFNKQELMIRIEKLLLVRKAIQVRFAGENPDTTEALPVDKVLNLDELFIRQLKNYIHENMDNSQLNVEQLAQVAQLSSTQLYRKLKALTNETPNAFIRNIRLQKGMELLKNTNLNISEIAYNVGFNDPNYFSRAFHKLYGKSPLTFRR